jgi:hypothetical protein
MEAARNREGARRIAKDELNCTLLPGSYLRGGSVGYRVLQFQVLGEHGENMVWIALDPEDWKDAERTGIIAKIVKGCSCMDAVHNGPICKHAAACLLVEARRNKSTFQERHAAAVLSGIARLHDTVDSKSSGFAKVKAKPSLTNTWMIEIFRHLTTRSRARPMVDEVRKPVLLLAIKGDVEETPKEGNMRVRMVTE